MDCMHHPYWAKAREELERSMGNEIGAMREILSNMLQEEMSLLAKDRASWEQLMESRFHLIQQIKAFRDDRAKSAQKLASLSDEKTFENLLSKEEGISCEISLLLDQLMALSQKINLQHLRNQSLLENPQHFIAIPSSVSYPPQGQGLPSPKGKKQFLMTIP